MKKYALVFILFFLQAAPTVHAKKLNLEEFQERLKKHADTLSKKTARSIQIEVLGTGRALYSNGEDNGLIPASSAKLVTTIAALEKLGPAFSFRTKVFQSGSDLVLLGSGDPYLVSERLWLLARAVARKGIKKVGSIKINNSSFSENYRGLLDFSDSGEPFSALVSATSLNFNSLEVHVTPLASGKPKVELGPVPHDYAVLINKVTQVSGRSRNVTVRSTASNSARETFTVSGTIGRDAPPAIVYGSVSFPESYLASVFAALLRKEGVSVAKDFGGATFSAIDSNAHLIAETESPPLMDIFRSSNTFSNNFMTEQVFHVFGSPDSTASLVKSRQAILEFLRSKSACKEAEIDNGSGLSWSTKISAHCFVDLLQFAYRDFRIFADLIGSLPVGGQTGTLKKRFKKIGSDFDPMKVRAKTGTIWSKQAVTSLVGYTQAASGELVAFAILLNDQRNDPDLLSGMRDWEDACVEYIQQLQL